MNTVQNRFTSLAQENFVRDTNLCEANNCILFGVDEFMNS